MKIKTKKQLNLSQLIDHVWENDVRSRTFIANDKHIPGKVNFDENGMVDIQTTVWNDETFTVEEEIEITEDTRLHGILVVRSNNEYHNYTNGTIKTFKNAAKFIYLLNDDGSIGQLIWTHDKGLVE